MASLGARFEKDELKRGYAIKHIINGDPDFPNFVLHFQKLN